MTKKRASPLSKKQKLQDEESVHTEIVSPKDIEGQKKKLNLLKDRYQNLVQLRYTEPENQNEVLLNELQEQKKTFYQILLSLENHIQELQQENAALKEYKANELKYKQEIDELKMNMENLTKKLEIADLERETLAKALKSIETSDLKNVDDKLELSIKLLDTFHIITGIKLTLELDNFSQGSCTIFNKMTGKGVKFGIGLETDEIVFDVKANKSLLKDFDDFPLRVKVDEVPKFITRVMDVILL